MSLALRCLLAMCCVVGTTYGCNYFKSDEFREKRNRFTRANANEACRNTVDELTQLDTAGNKTLPIKGAFICTPQYNIAQYYCANECRSVCGDIDAPIKRIQCRLRPLKGTPGNTSEEVSFACTCKYGRGQKCKLDATTWDVVEKAYVEDCLQEKLE